MAGVSVIVGCMNRSSFLLQSLPSWLYHPEIREIIIVDWSSDETLVIPPSLMEPRIKILRVEKTGGWILSLALNFAAQHTKYPLLLKLDADSVLDTNFFKKHPLRIDSNEFYSGNWRIARNENEKHLNGVVFLARQHFMQIGGYNEYIRTYGWDDSDLYNRLQQSGLLQKDFVYETISHIEHNNLLRTRGGQDIRLEIMKNMHLVKKLPWSAEKEPTRYIEIDCIQSIWEPINIEKYMPSASIIA